MGNPQLANAGLADAQDPVTVYKKDAFQGHGCTQLNLYGKSQAGAYEARGFTSGTCNGAGYNRLAGCVGNDSTSCSMGTLWLP